MSMLDTHVAVALYEGRTNGFSPRVRHILESGTALLSPAALLELELLNEIGRLRPRAEEIAASLAEQLSIRVATDPFAEIVREALPFSFTRDPFDRLLVAHAALRRAPFITFDGVLLKHYKLAMH